METNPCKDMIDIWVNNVFPDIALQAAGIRLFALVLASEPELNIPEAYKDMPGIPSDVRVLDSAAIIPEACNVRTKVFSFPMDIMVVQTHLNSAAKHIAAAMLEALKSHSGIIRGTARLHTTYDGSNHSFGQPWLKVTLIWLGCKHD